MFNHSDVSGSLQPHGLWSTRLLCPRDSPGKNTGVGCHFLLQRIFLTQGSNSALLVFCIAGRFLTTESLVKPIITCYCCSVAQLCLTLCNPMDCSMPSFLSFTISRSLLKLRSIELVMPSNDLVLCCPLLHLPSILLRIRIFSNESPLEFFEFCFLELSRKKFFSNIFDPQLVESINVQPTDTEGKLFRINLISPQRHQIWDIDICACFGSKDE